MSDQETGARRIHFLDALRGVAIVMVVAVHAMEYSWLTDQTKDFIRSFLAMSVPSFFLVDGYMFFFRMADRSAFRYWMYIQKSAKRLLIPWVIFSMSYVALRGLFEYVGVLTEPIVMGQGFWAIMKGMYLSSVSSQMYFLLSLFIIRGLTPIIRWLSGVPSSIGVVIFVGYVIAWNNMNFAAFFWEGFDPVLHALWGLQYYLLGGCLFNYKRHLHHRSSAIAVGIVIGYVAFKAVGGTVAWVEQYGYLLSAYFISMATMDMESIIARIGTMTMGIYLLHMPVILKMVSLITPSMVGTEGAAMNFLAITILTLLISFLLTKVLMSVSVGRFVLGDPEFSRGSYHSAQR